VSDLENLDQMNDEMGNNSDEDIALLLETQANETEQAERDTLVEIEQKEQEEKTEKAVDEAMGLAVAGVQTAAALAERKWKCLKFDDNTKVEVSTKAAAVLAKYDCKLPPWLEAYKEEIELGLCLGGVIAGAYVTVQKHNKAMAENDEGGQDGEESQQHAA